MLVCGYECGVLLVIMGGGEKENMIFFWYDCGWICYF